MGVGGPVGAVGWVSCGAGHDRPIGLYNKQTPNMF